MLWQRCVCMVVCLSSLAAAVSLQQCNRQGLVTVSPDQPYNVTCPHDQTTFNVTWLFTSLLDPPANYVITRECVLFSRSLDAYCESQVPGFRVVRPQFGFTGLEVDWGHLPHNLTFGMVTCLLDGVTSGTCFLRLMAPEPSTTASSSAVTSHLPSPSSPTSRLSESPTTDGFTVMRSSSSATGMTSSMSTKTSESTSTDVEEVSSSSSSAMSSPETVTSESSISEHSDTTPTMYAGSSSPSTSTTTTTATTTSTETSSISPHTQRIIIIAVVVGLVTTVPAIIVGAIVFCLWRKRRQRFQSMTNDEGSLQIEGTLDNTRRDSSFGPPPSKN